MPDNLILQQFLNAGKEFVGGASAAREADVGVKTVPLPFKLPSTPTSVLSDLNINEMNKRRVKTEELRSRKGCGAKGALQWILTGHSFQV